MAGRFFQYLSDEEKIKETLKEIAGILSGIPLLFTVRTKEEGGQAEITPEEYRKVNLAAAESGLATWWTWKSFPRRIPWN